LGNYATLSEIVETDVFIEESMSIQTQKGMNDCGMFVLANLVSICKGIDPILDGSMPFYFALPFYKAK
jgi:hypothetical protein